jgi:membrane-bound lytic murein transglycosylase D
MPFRRLIPTRGILSLIVVSVLACESRGQERSDPFDTVQRSLEFAADAQLALARTAIPAVENALLRPPAETWRTKSLFTDSLIHSSEKRSWTMGIDAKRIFAEEGLPTELLAVAKVESNLNLYALSPKGALGLWQLMPQTARRYGLRVDASRDERLDAEKSTRAGARYLRDLYVQFKDWPLVLAAYNVGEDALQHAVKRGGSNDFWELSRRRLLPGETRAYVAAILRMLESSGRQDDIGRRLIPGRKPSCALILCASVIPPAQIDVALPMSGGK